MPARSQFRSLSLTYGGNGGERSTRGDSRRLVIQHLTHALPRTPHMSETKRLRSRPSHRHQRPAQRLSPLANLFHSSTGSTASIKWGLALAIQQFSNEDCPSQAPHLFLPAGVHCQQHPFTRSVFVYPLRHHHLNCARFDQHAAGTPKNRLARRSFDQSPEFFACAFADFKWSP